MKLALFLLLATAAPAALAAGPARPPVPPVVLRAGRTRVVLPQRDAAGAHDYREEFCAGFLREAKLLALVERGATRYVVFTAAGWSRGPTHRGGRCGSGWERQINWVALRGGVVREHQCRDIESCWHDTQGSIEGWRGSRLTWSSDNREGLSACYFDRTAPHTGLQVGEFTPTPSPPVADPVPEQTPAAGDPGRVNEAHTTW